MWMFLYTAGWVANRIDPDQTSRSAVSDLGLYISALASADRRLQASINWNVINLVFSRNFV